ncbi:DeoR/GlpR family DNA-binding transcription regulator [Tropicibacter sp. S64]|uniref:DeoR/GlpR family DNA-binding transcription regulator n=1 Tax=Tropicibacter sp. S64 TaxID=3415122 RepID=UPI003C7D1D66
MTQADLSTGKPKDGAADGPVRLRKAERRERILFELKLRPHVRISELSEILHVSTETVRRDFDALADDGLVARAHGGATAASPGHYPGLDERAHARIGERERIGKRAALMVQPGETLMVDSGSTTIQFARALALNGTPCTVITNSIPIAMTLESGVQHVILCPGTYQPAESAVTGTDTLDYLARYNVDRCMIGASGLTEDGPSETVPGFAAVKRLMLARAASRHLLIDAQKFGRRGLNVVGSPEDLDGLVVDRMPEAALSAALTAGGVDIVLAD